VKDERFSSIPPVSSAGSGTLVTQNHLQNFQRNIFLPTNSNGHEWCDNSEYGYGKFASGYRGERIDPSLELKYRALEREKEEKERGRREGERLLEERLNNWSWNCNATRKNIRSIWIQRKRDIKSS
jgi:hypothetical protein